MSWRPRSAPGLRHVPVTRRLRPRSGRHSARRAGGRGARRRFGPRGARHRRRRRVPHSAQRLLRARGRRLPRPRQRAGRAPRRVGRTDGSQCRSKRRPVGDDQRSGSHRARAEPVLPHRHSVARPTPDRDESVALGPQLLALPLAGAVRAGCPHVEVHPVLGGLDLRHLQDEDPWPRAVRVDDGIRVVVPFGRQAPRGQRLRPSGETLGRGSST